MTECKPLNCTLISDFHFDKDKMSLSWDELLVGTSTSIWNNNGYIEMKVPNENDRVIRQTKEYYRAKGNKIIKAQFTSVLNINTSVQIGNGVTSMVGMYDDHNDKIDNGNSGFFFEYTLTDGTGNITHPLKVGIRYGVIDIGIDSVTDQYSFNINSINQNSGLSILDWSKIYTYEIKYNAIGYVEWSIYLDGEKLLLHRENNISKILNTLPTFNIPMRFEIINEEFGSNSSINEMRQFNASLCTEDNFSTSLCDPNTISTDQLKHLSELSKQIYTINTYDYEPLFSFRLKNEFRRDTIRIYEFFYLVHKKGPFSYAIIRNADLTTGNTPIWIDPGTAYKIEYDINANIAINISDCLYEQFVDANCYSGIHNNGSRICVLPSPLASDIIGNTDIFTIVIRKQSEKKITLNIGLRWVQ